MHPVSRKLLRWYQKNKRDLPWRKTRDPYKIWVAEAMLQQTRVDQVIPYYARFLARFPNAHTLVGAKEDDVLKAWEGLGYYSRARNLHAASKHLAGQEFPVSAVEWQKLPGVGPYMGNAIAAIAFNQNEIAMDANVFRVGARLFGIATDRDKVGERLHGILPSGKAGDFNQALMDLGAGTCLPRMPACPSCPLNKHCHAAKLPNPASLPRKKSRKQKPHQTVALGVIWNKDKVFIAKRPNTGLLAALWEFPGGKLENGESLKAACKREIREETGLRVVVGKKLATVKHEYTHLKVTLHVFQCKGNGTPHMQRKWKWVRPSQLKKFPMPRSNHKFMGLL